MYLSVKFFLQIKVRLWLLTLPDPDKDIICQIHSGSEQLYVGRAFRNDIELTVTCDGFTGLPTVPADKGIYIKSVFLTRRYELIV